VVCVVVLAFGACDGGGEEPGPCDETVPEDCVGETVCVAGACVAAYPRGYTIGPIRVKVAQTGQNGGSWDPGAGVMAAPDLYAAVSIDGTLLATTATIPDTYEAEFTDPILLAVTAGSHISVVVSDEDGATDTQAFLCANFPIDAGALRRRTIACGTEQDTPHVTLTITAN
jgi:hypothetical protein